MNYVKFVRTIPPRGSGRDFWVTNITIGMEEMQKIYFVIAEQTDWSIVTFSHYQSLWLNNNWNYILVTFFQVVYTGIKVRVYS